MRSLQTNLTQAGVGHPGLMPFPPYGPGVLRKGIEPRCKVVDRNNPFSTVSEHVHGDDSSEKCPLAAQLFVEPVAIVRKWNMAIPMAKQHFFGCEKYSAINPLAKCTLLMEALGQWVRDEPTIGTGLWRRKRLRRRSIRRPPRAQWTRRTSPRTVRSFSSTHA